MLNAPRESRRRSDNQRGSVQNESGSHRRGTDGHPQNASDDFLERNVPQNFLVETNMFDGFLYMMRQSDHPLAHQLRADLFPALAIALEAALHRAVHHQMQRDAESGVVRTSITSSKGKSYRKRSFFPEGEIQSREFNIVKALAEELRRVRSGNDVNNAQPSESK